MAYKPVGADEAGNFPPRVNAVRKDAPGIPTVETIYGPEYLSVVSDESGNIIEGVLTDGTKKVARHRVGDAGTTTDTVMPGWLSAVTDAAGNLIEGVRTDGTKVFGRVEVPETTRLPAVPKSVDVLFVLGQSKGMKSDWLNPGVDVVDPWVMVWDAATSSMKAILPDETHIGAYVAREYAARNPRRAVLVVVLAVGDTGFTTTSLASPPAGYTTKPGGTWDRTLTSDPLNLALAAPATMNAATNAVKSVYGNSALNEVWMLWTQGEADARVLTQTEYATKADDLFGYLRAQVVRTTMPIVVEPLMPEVFVYPEDGNRPPRNVDHAIADTPRRVVNTAFAPIPLGYMKFGESVHRSVAGMRVSARVITNALWRAKCNVLTSTPGVPNNVTVTRSGSLAQFKWVTPDNRVTAFTLRYSTDSGATWTTPALANPLDTVYETTITATLPVWAQVRTTNENGTSEFSIVTKG